MSALLRYSREAKFGIPLSSPQLFNVFSKFKSTTFVLTLAYVASIVCKLGIIENSQTFEIIGELNPQK